MRLNGWSGRLHCTRYSFDYFQTLAVKAGFTAERLSVMYRMSAVPALQSYVVLTKD